MVQVSYQEDVLMLKSTSRLLRHLHCLEGPAVNESEDGVDRFEPRLGLVRDRLASYQVDHQRVELSPQIGVEQRLVSCDAQLQVVDGSCLQLVESPTQSGVFLAHEEQLREVHGP